MSSSSVSNRTIIAILVVVALATAFWILVLSPKREEAATLGTEVQQQQAALVQAQSQVTEASAAKREFSSDYRQLVVLGKAAPADDETASLLVELNKVADHAGVKFNSLQLLSSEGAPAATSTTAPEASATSAVPAGATIPPTEAEAALLPLGAAIGSAGLAVMPYSLGFSGKFFQVADFVQGVDSLVRTSKPEIAIDGRLVTLDGFSLTQPSESPTAPLTASFAVTAYLTAPGQGVTAGATETAPATPAAATTPEASPSETEAR
jgi:Tfp pilus assembly protein PilO